MAKNFIDLTRCAQELSVTKNYTSKLFRKTGFQPVMRINQIAFYMRYDFDHWKDENGFNLCTGMRVA